MPESTALLAADVLATLDLPPDVTGNEPDLIHLRLVTACEYLDALRIADAGLAGYIASLADYDNPDALPHYVGVTAFGTHAALLEEDQLVVVCCYIDYIDSPECSDSGAGLTVADFIDWAFPALGLDRPADFTVLPLKAAQAVPVPAPEPPAKAKRSRRKPDDPLPGQQELPLAAAPAVPAAEAAPADEKPGRRVSRPGANGAAPAAAPAPEAPEPEEPDAPKEEKLPDWTGKKIKYRAGKKIVVGLVTAGAGATLNFTDEQGDAWTGVARTLCKVIRDTAAPAAAALPPQEPEIVLSAPAPKVAKYQALFDKPDSFVASKPADSVLYSFSVALTPAVKVYAEVINGTPDCDPPRGCYLDVFAMEGSTLLFTAPPSRTFTGRYELTIAGAVRILEIRAE
jgi:hypothetical protein